MSDFIVFNSYCVVGIAFFIAYRGSIVTAFFGGLCWPFLVGALLAQAWYKRGGSQAGKEGE